MSRRKTKKRPEENKPIDNQQETSEGVVEGLLRGLGHVMPGVGGLLKGLEKSEAFQERLREANEEIEARLRNAPFKGGMEADRWPRPAGGIPRRAANKSEYVASVRRQKEVSVDVFDEGHHWRVTAEMPGIEEKDIQVNLQGDVLTISADTVHRKYDHVVKLPGASRQILQTAYRNGILELRLEKESG